MHSPAPPGASGISSQEASGSSFQAPNRGGAACSRRPPARHHHRRPKQRPRQPESLNQPQASSDTLRDSEQPDQLDPLPQSHLIPDPPCIPEQKLGLAQPEHLPRPQPNPESLVNHETKLERTRPEPQRTLNGDGASTSSGTVVKKTENGEVYDLISHLERFSICDSGGEISLPPDVVLLNEQRQEDELLALEAIFGDNVTIFPKGDTGLRFVQIQICWEFSDGINVAVELQAASKSTSIEKNSADEFVYQFSVRYLPPITLTCLMPASYPSHRAPYFLVSAMWLDQSKLSVLCGQLDMIWEEQNGLEVLFPWVQWLHDSSLTHLGFDNGITLSRSDTEGYVDARSISQYISLENVVPFMTSYSEAMAQKAFISSSHVCMICFNELAGMEFIRLPCQHFFCIKCLETYCKMHVKEATVHLMTCPDAKCGGLIPPINLKKLLTVDEFERWESLLLEKTLESMTDITYCPRCKTACLEDDDSHAQCSKCFFSFCTLCFDHRHVGEKCMTPEERILFLEKKKEAGGFSRSQLQKALDAVNVAISYREILRSSKQCPVCSMAIHKSEGCNKMVCRNCGSFFCYKCGQSIDGYDHFREGGSCALFSQEEIDRWERQMNGLPTNDGRDGNLRPRDHGHLLAEATAELYPDQVYPCPGCRQQNLKIENNNHLRCWACGIQYCALCKKRFLKSTEHFGPRGCKQHTAGRSTT